jgi:exodeoxyribonuclease VII large subunit
VPDVADELRGVAGARDRLRGVLAQMLDRERQSLADLRARPVLADPRSLVDARATEVRDLRERGRRVLGHALERAGDDIGHQRARARSLSPLATLQRGYAVVQGVDGSVLASTAGVTTGDALRIRVGDGRILATATGVQPETDPPSAVTEEAT